MVSELSLPSSRVLNISIGLMKYYSKRWLFFTEYAYENGCGHHDMTNYDHEIMTTVEQQFNNLDMFPLSKETQIDDYAPIMQTIWEIYKPLV